VKQKSIAELEADYIKRIANAIRGLRIQRNMTQKQLAENICERSTITHIESGKIKLPSFTTLRLICDKFGITTDELFTLAYDDESDFNLYKKMRMESLIKKCNYEQANDITKTFKKEAIGYHDQQYLLYVKGVFLSSKKNYEKAQVVLKRAMGITNINDNRKYVTINELKIAYAILNNSISSKDMSKLQKEKIMSRALKIKSSLDEYNYEMNCKDVIALYANIGDIFRFCKEQEYAESCFEKAEKICLISDNYDEYGRILFLKSLCFFSMPSKYTREKIIFNIEQLFSAIKYFEILKKNTWVEYITMALQDLLKYNPNLKEYLDDDLNRLYSFELQKS